VSSRVATIAALLMYFAILLGVGWWTRKRQSTFGEYVTGGGHIPAWMLALSFFANFVSSNSFVGHAGKSYQAGLIWCLVGAIMVVCCFVSWTFFAPGFARAAKERGLTTLPEFFASRFRSERLGQIVHWVVVIATLFYALAVLRGTATVVRAGLGIGHLEALLVLYVVTLAYCLMGGLWADVTTDVVQAVVLTVGAIAMFAALLMATPSTQVVAPPLQPPPIELIVAIGLGGGLKLLTDPKQVMVFYALSDPRAARRFRFAVPLLLLVTYTALMPAGYLARDLVAAPSNLEELIPSLFFGSAPILPAALGILFMTALLAASMSSLDSAFLVMASCLERHLVSRMAKREPTTKSTRVILFVVATVTLLLSIDPPGDIISLTTFAGALVGGSLVPAIVVGLGKRQVPAVVIGLSVVLGAAAATLSIALNKLELVASSWNQDVFAGLGSATAVILLWLLLSKRAPGQQPRQPVP